jgi:hypothetical protein
MAFSWKEGHAPSFLLQVVVGLFLQHSYAYWVVHGTILGEVVVHDHSNSSFHLLDFFLVRTVHDPQEGHLERQRNHQEDRHHLEWQRKVAVGLARVLHVEEE